MSVRYEPAAIALLENWDRDWAEQYQHMATNPWRTDNLPPRTIALIGVALHAACTTLDVEGTRTHIRAALAAGASYDEILVVFKMASLLAITPAAWARRC